MGGEGRLKVLVIPKAYPRAIVTAGPILVHHCLKNLSRKEAARKLDATIEKCRTNR